MSTVSQEFQKYIKGHFFKVILIMLFVLLAGCAMLFEFATWDSPVLGNTFHIVAGCLSIFLAVTVLVFAIKVRYFQKKRRRSRKPVFLKKN